MRAETPVRTLKELTDLIERAYPGAVLIEVKAYGLDSRNGWYSHHVNIRMPDQSLKLIGFTSGPL